MHDITPELLLKAYSIGIFPMAESHDATDIHWISPEQRGILPLDRFHIPRSLAKILRKGIFEVRYDENFVDVIKACGEITATRKESWINQQIIDSFIALHHMGLAHSVECWHDGKLAGGLYGLALGGAFFGESMFSRVPDASKVALAHLVARLKRSGFTLLDTQFITTHLARFGTIEIPRAEYLAKLRHALSRQARF